MALELTLDEPRKRVLRGGFALQLNAAQIAQRLNDTPGSAESRSLLTYEPAAGVWHFSPLFLPFTEMELYEVDANVTLQESATIKASEMTASGTLLQATWRENPKPGGATRKVDYGMRAKRTLAAGDEQNANLSDALEDATGTSLEYVTWAKTKTALGPNEGFCLGFSDFTRTGQWIRDKFAVKFGQFVWVLHETGKAVLYEANSFDWDAQTLDWTQGMKRRAIWNWQTGASYHKGRGQKWQIPAPSLDGDRWMALGVLPVGIRSGGILFYVTGGATYFWRYPNARNFYAHDPVRGPTHEWNITEGGEPLEFISPLGMDIRPQLNIKRWWFPSTGSFIVGPFNVQTAPGVGNDFTTRTGRTEPDNTSITVDYIKAASTVAFDPATDTQFRIRVTFAGDGNNRRTPWFSSVGTSLAPELTSAMGTPVVVPPEDILAANFRYSLDVDQNLGHLTLKDRDEKYKPYMTRSEVSCKIRDTVTNQILFKGVLCGKPKVARQMSGGAPYDIYTWDLQNDWYWIKTARHIWVAPWKNLTLPSLSNRTHTEAYQLTLQYAGVDVNTINLEQDDPKTGVSYRFALDQDMANEEVGGSNALVPQPGESLASFIHEKIIRNFRPCGRYGFWTKDEYTADGSKEYDAGVPFYLREWVESQAVSKKTFYATGTAGRLTYRHNSLTVTAEPLEANIVIVAGWRRDEGGVGEPQPPYIVYMDWGSLDFTGAPNFLGWPRIKYIPLPDAVTPTIPDHAASSDKDRQDYWQLIDQLKIFCYKNAQKFRHPRIIWQWEGGWEKTLKCGDVVTLENQGNCRITDIDLKIARGGANTRNWTVSYTAIKLPDAPTAYDRMKDYVGARKAISHGGLSRKAVEELAEHKAHIMRPVAPGWSQYEHSHRSRDLQITDQVIYLTDRTKVNGATGNWAGEIWHPSLNPIGVAPVGG